MSESASLGMRLRSVREFYGWSQRELAKRAGVPNSAISVIEQGSVSPSIQSLEKVLKGFPISITDFFSFDVTTATLRLQHQECVSDDANMAVNYLKEPERIDSGFSLRRFCQTKSDTPLNMIARGRTLVLLVRGSATYYSLGAETVLIPGSSLSLQGVTPYRLEPSSDRAEWIVASMNPADN